MASPTPRLTFVACLFGILCAALTSADAGGASAQQYPYAFALRIARVSRALSTALVTKGLRQEPAAATITLPPKAHRASYLNYDIAGGSNSFDTRFAYGTRIGAGVAEVDMAARAGSEPGINIVGGAWQRSNDDTGSTLTIGDVSSYSSKYADTVNFDGVAYTSAAISYAAGWERTDFGDSAPQFGSFIAALQTNKSLGRRLTVQGELFADATTKFAALGGTWRTLHAGNVQVGIAPAASGLTGYVAYTLYTPRLAVNVGDRVWSPQVVDAEDTLPNSRQLRGTVDYTVTRTGKVHFAYASMVQGGFPLRTYALGYVQRMGGLDLHADVTETVAFGTTRAGLAAYFSLPLGNGTTLSGANNAFNAISQNPTTPKQQRMSTDFGAQYALNFGDGTSLTNATFSSRAAGSTARLNVSRFGGHVSLNSEFSGSLVFLGGKALATNEVIDQDSALDALNGRSAATLIAVNESGQWLSAGTIVRAATDVGQWRVGPDGRVDIDDIGAGPQTLVVTSRTANCIIAIVVPPNATNAYDLGTQVCRKTQQL